MILFLRFLSRVGSAYVRLSEEFVYWFNIRKSIRWNLYVYRLSYYIGFFQKKIEIVRNEIGFWASYIIDVALLQS